MNVELKIDHYTIKIFIDGLVHLFLWREEFIGFQSWSDGGDSYSIEFYTKSNSFVSQMDAKEKWLMILKELDEKL